MKKINIEVTHAQILSFNVTLSEGKPEVGASIGLYSAGGKQISTYSISTSSWREEDKFELPVELIAPIVSIMQTLEKVVVKHCNDNQKQLTGGENDPF